MTNEQILLNLLRRKKKEEALLFLEKNYKMNVNIKDKYERTPILYSVIFSKKITEKLIKMGAQIDALDNEKRTILYKIILLNKKKIFNLLLKYHEKVVGKNIFLLRDSYNLYPIHYAILNNNNYFVKKIMTHYKEINFVDEKGNNILLFSIYKRSNLATKLLKYVDINDSNNKKRTALHYSCIMGTEINFLLKEKININSLDDRQRNCLYYSTNIDRIKRLIKKIDINNQDIYGNTIFHHYFINNIDMRKLCSPKEIGIGEIFKNYNYDLANIDGNTILHLALLIMRNELDKIEDRIILKFLLSKSDINIQNKKGETSLHILIRKFNWLDFRKILRKKKMNINIRDNKNKIILDYLNISERNKFIITTAKSYLYTLEKNKIEYKKKIDKQCSKLGNEKYDICLKKIKKIIRKNIGNQNYISNPILENEYLLTGIINKKINIKHYIGNNLDIIMGLLYIVNKHNCYTPIYYDEGDKKLRFEVKWDTLYINMNDKLLEEINMRRDRYIILPIKIIKDEQYHLNYLFYDKNIKEIERFEPNGSNHPLGMDYDEKKLDAQLKEIFEKKNIKYISPTVYLPKIGLQLLEIQENYTHFDNLKFCSLWCIWYIEMRLLFGNQPREKLIGILIKSIKYCKKSFSDTIREFSNNIIDIRNRILDKENMNINDYVNNVYPNEKIIKLEQNILLQFNLFPK